MAGIKYHDVTQGSDEWFALRCGLLTASEIKLIMTPTFKAAANDKERGHLFELLAQRITRYVEPSYIGEDMLRGYDGEVIARELYHKTFAPVTEMGFITNDKWGFTIGYSPDGLVGENGQIEIKSRKQKLQVQSVVIDVANGQAPVEHLLQVQSGLLVSERDWCDFLSYSPGLPMTAVKVAPDPVIHEAIVNIAG
ncbi:MAG TPA: YqaJ viral recombinase family protein, partial [Terricaulis sp.]|nr:YqaJ viral recombinase family protein [Terricaulis sp.]